MVTEPPSIVTNGKKSLKTLLSSLVRPFALANAFIIVLICSLAANRRLRARELRLSTLVGGHKTPQFGNKPENIFKNLLLVRSAGVLAFNRCHSFSVMRLGA